MSQHFSPYLHSFLSPLCAKPCNDSNITQSKSTDLTSMSRACRIYMPPITSPPIPLTALPPAPSAPTHRSLCCVSDMLFKFLRAFTVAIPSRATVQFVLCRALQAAVLSPDSIIPWGCPFRYARLTPSHPAGLGSNFSLSEAHILISLPHFFN